MIPTDEFVLTGTNTVLRPFPFRLEFPISEGQEFLTDVITAADGTEQRIAVRDPARPRQHVAAHIIVFDRDELAQLKALLFGWNLKQYGVPLWFHAMRLAAAASIGDTALTVDDADGRDLTDRLASEEDVPVLLWRAHDDWEPAVLAAAAGGTLTLRDGLARAWPAGETTVLPLALMLLVSDPLQMETPARAIAELDLEFVHTNYPISPNAPCADAGERAARALLVRPRTGAGLVDVYGTGYGADHANAGSFFPQSSDAPHDLYGFTVTAQVGGNYLAEPALDPASKGRVSGFSRCTAAAPTDFDAEIVGVGLGSTVGTDCDLSVHGAFPAGLTADGPHTVGGAITGSGYFPAPSAPTARNWVVAIATLRAGIAPHAALTGGDSVSSYGRYAAVPGGIQSYPVSPEVAFNGDYVRLQHGYCVRLTQIAAYLGVKLTTEEVLYSSPGVESGLFGAPNVTTHAFDAGDFAAALTPAGAFVVALTGDVTLFGQAHVANGTQKLYRVTVALTDAGSVDREQFVDIFPTMYVAAEKGT